MRSRSHNVRNRCPERRAAALLENLDAIGPRRPAYEPCEWVVKEFDATVKSAGQSAKEWPPGGAISLSVASRS